LDENVVIEPLASVNEERAEGGTMRSVLVGCGRMSGAWLEAAARIDGLTVAGLVDLDTAAAERQAIKHALPNAVIGRDLVDVLRETKADIVFDVVVPGGRRGVVETALVHGCHVLSEKPMAESLDDARALIAAAQQAGRMHVVIQNRRYLAGVRRLRRFLAGGTIGEIAALNCDFFLAPRFGGFREEMAHPLLLDMAIHTFDVGRLLSGDVAEAVYCREWNPPGSWFAHGASAVAVFEMRGGAVFTYRGSWCAEGLQTSWEAQWRIVGTRGTVLWDGDDSLRCEVHDATTPRDGLFAPARSVEIPPLDPADRIGGHLGVMQDFWAALHGGPEPETVGHQNIKSLAMVFGAIASAAARARVAIG
jgi:predicted dehydrogenase